jgi:hypothetical protein
MTTMMNLRVGAINGRQLSPIEKRFSFRRHSIRLTKLHPRIGGYLSSGSKATASLDRRTGQADYFLSVLRRFCHATSSPNPGLRLPRNRSVSGTATVHCRPGLMNPRARVEWCCVRRFTVRGCFRSDEPCEDARAEPPPGNTS